MPVEIENQPVQEIEEFHFDPSTIDFSELEEQYAIHEEDYLSTILIIDGIPVVDSQRAEKLLLVLKKIFAKLGVTKLEEDAIHMPVDEKGKSKGFLFLECGSLEQATQLERQVDGYRLDARHTFSVIRLADMERCLATPETFVPPKQEPYQEKEQLNSWLMDEYARDQFFMLAGDDVSVMWNEKSLEPEEVQTRSMWTESYMQWSPFGTYLVSFHKQGVALWGGQSWSRIVRFPHQGVKLADFSPNENYFVTWSKETSSEKNENLRVWDVRTGKLLRGFSIPPLEKMEWPLFKWSGDVQYVARSQNEAILIYQLPSFTLLDQKSLKVKSLQQFSMSPKDNYLAYWTPEDANNPARVTVIELPSRNIIRTKNLFGVSECSLYWHGDGDYLAVKVDRLTKNKKNVFTTLEVFCMRSKNVPIEVFEGLKEKQVQALTWEPEGNRFAILALDGQRTYVGFYRMDKEVLEELKLVESKNISNLFWSPKGHYIVLAGVRSSHGELEFWDVDELQVMESTEHFQVSEVEWDPTGRYVITGNSFWRHPGENGFIIWDFRGQCLLKKTVERFKQLLWRPRPKSLLSKDQMKSIRKNLKTYGKEFDEVDLLRSGAVAKEAYLRYKQLQDDWLAWREECKQRYAAERLQRAQLRGSVADPEFSDDEAEDGTANASEDSAGKRE